MTTQPTRVAREGQTPDDVRVPPAGVVVLREGPEHLRAAVVQVIVGACFPQRLRFTMRPEHPQEQIDCGLRKTTIGETHLFRAQAMGW